MSIVAVVIPQRAYLGTAFDSFAKDAPGLARALTALGLDRIYGGWPILIISAVLAVNLIACTLRRVLMRPRPGASNIPDAASLRRVATHLAEQNWRLLGTGDRRVSARKGGSGFLGSVLMHAGLIVIIAGFVATTLTSFRGEMVVSEGQTLADVRDSYRSVASEPKVGEPYSGTRVTLDSTIVDYSGGVVVSAVARMRALEPDGDIITRDVRVNHPLDAGGKSYLLQGSGYAAHLIIAPRKAPASPIVVALADETSLGWEDRLDTTTTAGTPLRIEMLATPMPLGDSQVMPAEKFALNDPRLRLNLKYGASSWSGVLAPGESTPDVGGVSVTFERLGLWNRYLVRGEPARWITYTGFWLTLAGALWRFAVPERRIAVATSAGGAVDVSLRARPWAGFAARADEVLVAQLEALTSPDIHDDEGVNS